MRRIIGHLVYRVNGEWLLRKAAGDVAAALADVAVGPPADGMLELAGPESESIAAFVAQSLEAHGDTRQVVADKQARYFFSREEVV